jgi:nucleoside-diphosphate-sugar epimerase
MNVFIVGASGYVGRAVTARVLNGGHRVTALVRSEVAAARLPAGDVRVVAGAVEDLQAVQDGLEGADAAIYLAIQGTTGASVADRAALNAIVDDFRGTQRPLIVTSGLSVYVGRRNPSSTKRLRSTRCLRRRPGVSSWSKSFSRLELALSSSGRP